MCINGALVSFPSYANAPVLNTNNPAPTAGYYQLSWHIAGAESGKNNPYTGEFILQEAHHKDFSDADTIYKGMDTASVISGKPNGSYFYRVSRANPMPEWSESVQVQVTHHSLQRAFIFFSIGAVVFILILTVIWRESK